jgi:tRNA threonylcarbamoyladenosine biosynthesis protein TsaB
MSGSQASRAAPVLALDTSTATARVAVVAEGGRALAAGERTAPRHSASLMPLVDEVLRASGLRLADLGAIACGRGPGSFTGLRVGLAVGKGLALGAGRPLVLASSLEALARDLAATAPGALCVPCLDAGKGEVYAALFRATAGGLARDTEDLVLGPGDLAELVRDRAGGAAVAAGGPGLDRHAQALAPAWGEGALRRAFPGPTAAAIAAIARERLARGEEDDLEAAAPAYGRPPDITRPGSDRGA